MRFLVNVVKLAVMAVTKAGRARTPPSQAGHAVMGNASRIKKAGRWVYSCPNEGLKDSRNLCRIRNITA